MSAAPVTSIKRRTTIQLEKEMKDDGMSDATE